jgi:hypothetical protein
VELIRIADYELSCDRDATVAAYRGFEPYQCECEGCVNYRLARSSIFTPEVLAFLGQFGIDANKEAEVYIGMGTLESGFVHYGGWFHFVGRIEKDGEESVKVTERMTFYFGAGGSLVPESFGDAFVVQVEMDATVPWLLPGPCKL